MRRKSTPARTSSHWSDLSEAAEKGNYEAGEKLLQGFATLAEDPTNPHPDLVRHVAQCVKNFLQGECSERIARQAFCVKRPEHRPASKEIEERHAEALVAYFNERALGSGREAAISAGSRVGGFSESAMKKILEADSTLARFNALFCLPKATQEKVLEPPRKKYQRRPK